MTRSLLMTLKINYVYIGGHKTTFFDGRSVHRNDFLHIGQHEIRYPSPERSSSLLPVFVWFKIARALEYLSVEINTEVSYCSRRTVRLVYQLKLAVS
jgi:hypothetical protein